MLYPEGSGAPATIRGIVDAIARNEAQATSDRVRHAFMDKVRRNVLANRERAA